MGILPISRSLIKAPPTFLLLCVFLSVYHATASLMCGEH